MGIIGIICASIFLTALFLICFRMIMMLIGMTITCIGLLALCELYCNHIYPKDHSHHLTPNFDDCKWKERSKEMDTWTQEERDQYQKNLVKYREIRNAQKKQPKKVEAEEVPKKPNEFEKQWGLSVTP